MSDGIDGARRIEHASLQSYQEPVAQQEAGSSAASAMQSDVLTTSRTKPVTASIPESALSPAAAQTQTVDARALDEINRQLAKQMQASHQTVAANNLSAGHGHAREAQPDEASTIQATAQGGNVAFPSSDGHIGDPSLHPVAQPGIYANQSVQNVVEVGNEASRRVTPRDENQQNAQDEYDELADDDFDNADDENGKLVGFAHLVRPMNADSTSS